MSSAPTAQRAIGELSLSQKRQVGHLSLLGLSTTSGNFWWLDRGCLSLDYCAGTTREQTSVGAIVRRLFQKSMAKSWMCSGLWKWGRANRFSFPIPSSISRSWQTQRS